MNSQAVFAKRTGMIILGGGLVKHHIANANLMVASYCVTITSYFLLYVDSLDFLKGHNLPYIF